MSMDPLNLQARWISTSTMNCKMTVVDCMVFDHMDSLQKRLAALAAQAGQIGHNRGYTFVTLRFAGSISLSSSSYYIWDLPDIIALYNDPVHSKNITISKQKQITNDKICSANLLSFSLPHYCHLQYHHMNLSVSFNPITDFIDLNWSGVSVKEATNSIKWLCRISFHVPAAAFSVLRTMC